MDERYEPTVEERTFDGRRLDEVTTRPEGAEATRALDGDPANASSDLRTVTSPPETESDRPNRRDTGRREPPVVHGDTHLEELYFFQSVMDDDLSRPYLEALPSDRLADQIVTGWLRHLLGQAGFRGARDLIDQYAAVGWLGEDVRTELDEYLRTFHDAPKSESSVTTDVHRTSLTYIARLALLA